MRAKFDGSRSPEVLCLSGSTASHTLPVCGPSFIPSPTTPPSAFGPSHHATLGVATTTAGSFAGSATGSHFLPSWSSSPSERPLLLRRVAHASHSMQSPPPMSAAAFAANTAAPSHSYGGKASATGSARSRRILLALVLMTACSIVSVGALWRAQRLVERHMATAAGCCTSGVRAVVPARRRRNSERVQGSDNSQGAATSLSSDVGDAMFDKATTLLARRALSRAMRHRAVAWFDQERAALETRSAFGAGQQWRWPIAAAALMANESAVPAALLDRVCRLPPDTAAHALRRLVPGLVAVSRNAAAHGVSEARRWILLEGASYAAAVAICRCSALTLLPLVSANSGGSNTSWYAQTVPLAPELLDTTLLPPRVENPLSSQRRRITAASQQSSARALWMALMGSGAAEPSVSAAPTDGDGAGGAAPPSGSPSIAGDAGATVARALALLWTSVLSPENRVTNSAAMLQLSGVDRAEITQAFAGCGYLVMRLLRGLPSSVSDAPDDAARALAHDGGGLNADELVMADGGQREVARLLKAHAVSDRDPFDLVERRHSGLTPVQELRRLELVASLRDSIQMAFSDLDGAATATRGAGPLLATVAARCCGASSAVDAWRSTMMNGSAAADTTRASSAINGGADVDDGRERRPAAPACASLRRLIAAAGIRGSSGGMTSLGQRLFASVPPALAGVLAASFAADWADSLQRDRFAAAVGAIHGATRLATWFAEELEQFVNSTAKVVGERKSQPTGTTAAAKALACSAQLGATVDALDAGYATQAWATGSAADPEHFDGGGSPYPAGLCSAGIAAPWSDPSVASSDAAQIRTALAVVVEAAAPGREADAAGGLTAAIAPAVVAAKALLGLRALFARLLDDATALSAALSHAPMSAAASTSNEQQSETPTNKAERKARGPDGITASWSLPPHRITGHMVAVRAMLLRLREVYHVLRVLNFFAAADVGLRSFEAARGPAFSLFLQGKDDDTASAVGDARRRVEYGGHTMALLEFEHALRASFDFYSGSTVPPAAAGAADVTLAPGNASFSLPPLRADPMVAFHSLFRFPVADLPAKCAKTPFDVPGVSVSDEPARDYLTLTVLPGIECFKEFHAVALESWFAEVGVVRRPGVGLPMPLAVDVLYAAARAKGLDLNGGRTYDLSMYDPQAYPTPAQQLPPSPSCDFTFEGPFPHATGAANGARDSTSSAAASASAGLSGGGTRNDDDGLTTATRANALTAGFIKGRATRGWPASMSDDWVVNGRRRLRFAIVTLAATPPNDGRGTVGSGSTSAGSGSASEIIARILADMERRRSNDRKSDAQRELLLRMRSRSLFSFRQYCEAQGFALHVEGQEIVDRGRPAAWSKLRALRKWLPHYDWVAWVDADVLFMNHTLDLTQFMPQFLRDRESSLAADDVAARRQNDAEAEAALAAYAGDDEGGLMTGLADGLARDVTDARKHFTAVWQMSPGGRADARADVTIRDRAYIQQDFAPSSSRWEQADDETHPDVAQRAIDVVMTSDWNGPNSGVVLLRRSAYTLHLLRRLWAVDAARAAPYWEQGAMLFLMSQRGKQPRPERCVEEDRSHLWLLNRDGYRLNGYPEPFLVPERKYAYAAGDLLVHFASCRYQSICPSWFDAMFNESLCRNAPAGHSVGDEPGLAVGSASTASDSPREVLRRDVDLAHKYALPPSGATPAARQSTPLPPRPTTEFSTSARADSGDQQANPDTVPGRDAYLFSGGDLVGAIAEQAHRMLEAAAAGPRQAGGDSFSAFTASVAATLRGFARAAAEVPDEANDVTDLRLFMYDAAAAAASETRPDSQRITIPFTLRLSAATLRPAATGKTTHTDDEPAHDPGVGPTPAAGRGPGSDDKKKRKRKHGRTKWRPPSTTDGAAVTPQLRGPRGLYGAATPFELALAAVGYDDRTMHLT